MTTIFSKPNSFNAEIVRENSAISGLEDGKVYVLAARTDLFVDAVKTAIKHFKNLMDNREGLIYHYDISVIENVESVITSGALHDAVRNGVNIILPISTPNIAEKQYIVAKSEAALLDMYIPSMVMQAENLTKKAIEEALINLAIQESESCSKLLGDVYLNNLSSEVDDDPFRDLFCSMGDFAMAMAPTRGLYGAIPIDTSYKKSREIMSRFVENCKLINKTEKKNKLSKVQVEKLQKAQSEVNYVFNLFTPNVYSRFALQMMKKNDISLAFDNCINRDKIAANSKLVVSVEYAKPEIDAKLDPKIVKKLKTNGKFRVYLSDGEDTVQVKFGRAASCIVYIMYLLDRKQRGDEIDTLKISNNEKLFCELYGAVYNKSEAKDTFKTLESRFDGGKVKRSRLTDCYSDIRKALDESVSEFGESALPFYIPNEYSHITVLSSNISIHEAFENLSFVY
ncbi:MAG: hypothetical protein IKA81_03580 [Alistipes sp.]|nr:hypothetical protein [Alistipes sp.]